MLKDLPFPVQSKIITSLIIFITAFILSTLLKIAIDFVLLRALSSKAKTLRVLLKSAIDAVIYFVAALMVLSYWGFNIIPLLTSAGLVGLAFSLGAQSLFKDLIAGFFILVENQYNVGDRIRIDKYEGEVVKISLRLTVLKDKEGNYVYLPNSQIMAVVRITGKRA